MPPKSKKRSIRKKTIASRKKSRPPRKAAATKRGGGGGGNNNNNDDDGIMEEYDDDGSNMNIGKNSKNGGEDSEDSDNYDQDEIDKFVQKAKNGNTNAMYTLSTLKRDRETRKMWLKKAANSGHDFATNQMRRKNEMQKRFVASKLVRNMWQPNEQILFTRDIVGTFGAMVGDKKIITPDNMFYKQNIMGRKDVRKNIFTDDLLYRLPCPQFRGYMENSISKVTIDYAFIKSKTNDRISAIIFAELGECKEYPQYWTVRLICGTAGTKDARTLLGLYLFALKSIGQPIGILEVAQSYNNLAAYCLYAKFGFEEAYMYEDWAGCTAFSSMPLVNNLDTILPQEIIDITTNKSSFDNKLCQQPIVKATQNAHIKNVLLPKWTEAGYNAGRFFR